MTQSTDSSQSNSMQSVTPHLVCAGALQAIEFYKAAFDAVEELRLLASDGKLMHARLRIGNAAVMLAEENPAWGSLGPKLLKGSPVVIHLVVPNVDATMSQAQTAGATIVMPASDMFWGDRYGMLEDPFGHRWSVATEVRKMSPDEMQEAATKMFAQHSS